MDKSNKLYTEAFKSYRNGNIEKAIQLCESSISENIKNSSAINLKGLLLYLKGDIDSAQCLWKMNYEVNKDLISKKYLKDSEKDRERLNLFKAAVELFKELNISEALELLLKCSESDFNSIDVNNYIAACLIKKGEYQTAIKHIDKVIEIDSRNKMALQNKKLLNEYQIIRQDHNYKPILIILIFLFISGTSILVLRNIKNKNPIAIGKNSKTEQNIEQKNLSIGNTGKSSSIEQQETPIASSTEPQNSQTKIDENTKEKTEQLNVEEVKGYIEAKDFNKLYGVLKIWENIDVKAEQKDVLKAAQKLMESEGTEFFYNSGKTYVDKLELTKGRDEFLKAYEFGDKNSLYQSTIYMLAATNYNLGNIDEAIKFYAEYENKFPKGNSEETVLYEMAVINEDRDINIAKNYAKKLQKSYPNSRYYNDTEIRKILTK